MKKVIKAIVTFIIVFTHYGIICPYLISSTNTFLVILGFMLLIGIVVVLVVWWWDEIMAIIQRYMS